MTESFRHIAVTIARAPERVYDYARRPQNMAEWAAGLGHGLQQDVEAPDVWHAQGPSGSVRIRFAAPNELGVIDHRVENDAGLSVYMPMRVLAHGADSNVVITLFRLPDMDDASFEADASQILSDLLELKQRLES